MGIFREDRDAVIRGWKKGENGEVIVDDRATDWLHGRNTIDSECPCATV